MFVEIRKNLINPNEPARLPLVLITVGNTDRQVKIVRTEGADFHQMLWVARGSGLFSVRGEFFTLREGEGLFCRKGVPHTYERVDDCFATQWVTFLGGDTLLDYGGVSDWHRFLLSPTMRNAVDTLHESCVDPHSTVISRSGAGYLWLSEWIEEVTAPQITVEQAVRRYLEAHYADPITLDDVARAVHMSRYALCHYYSRVRGVTVMEQLKRIRIAKAKQFLRFTAYPISEVGAMCGFESASYFGKQFRIETGRTPGEYRARYETK